MGAWYPTSSGGAFPADLATNGVTSKLLLTPGADNENALSIKIPNATWGVGQTYGSGQVLELIEDGAVDVSDQTAAGPVRYRLDSLGNVGSNGGYHFATGLRAPLVGNQIVWMQPQMDIPGIIYDQFATAVSSFMIVRRSDGTKALEVFGNADATVEPIGSIVGYANNGANTPFALQAGDTPSGLIRAIFKSVVASVVPVVASGLAVATQTADLAQFKNTTTIGCRVDKSGYFMTRKSVAPADADLANNEAAIWVDGTVGVTKLMIKAKDSAGTVRTGSLNLI